MSPNKQKSASRFAGWVKILLILIGLAYPFIVYFGLDHFSPLVIGGALILVLLLRLVFLGKGHKLEAIGVLVAIVAVAALLPIDDQLAVKIYPIAMSLGLGGVFAWSLFNPPSLIERLARLREPDLPDHAIAYTRNVTKVWVGFFIVNACISTWTTLYGDLAIWTFYNGFLSYILMGCLFAGEFVLRIFVKRKHEAGE